MNFVRVEMFEVKGNIWIEGPNGTLIGLGRMNLLERIFENGSISEAARGMKMSYRQAWELVDAMNKESKEPLVTTASGGVGGGGAVLTEKGLETLKYYKSLLSRFEKFKKSETEKLVE
ncbi:winged helix-turn-helix domain-containing protein [soil metagenome]